MSERSRAERDRQRLEQRDKEKGRKKKPNSRGGLGSNRFLPIVLGAALLVTTGVCLGLKTQPSTPAPEVPLADLQPTEYASHVKTSEHLQIFPELRTQTLRSSGEFKAGGITTRWVNYTTLPFNARAAANAYTYFDTLPSVDIPYSIETDSTVFKREPLNITNRFVYILPDNAPKYNSGGLTLGGGVTEGKARTMRDKEKNRTITILLTTPKDPNLIKLNQMETGLGKDDINDRFFTEACQGSVGVTGESMIGDILGQEIICNSEGDKYSARQKNIQAEDIIRFMSQVHIIAVDRPFPLMVPTKEDFERIPKTGKAFS